MERPYYNLGDGDFYELNPIITPYRSQFDCGDYPRNKEGRLYDEQKALRYFAALYDKGGNAREIEGMSDRRIHCLHVAGIDVDHLLNWHTDMVEVKKPWFRSMCNAILVAQFNTELITLQTYQDAIITLNIKVRETAESSDLNNLIKIKEKYNALLLSLNGEPLEQNRMRDIDSILNQKSLGIRPEEYILRFEKGHKLFVEHEQ